MNSSGGVETGINICVLCVWCVRGCLQAPSFMQRVVMSSRGKEPNVGSLACRYRDTQSIPITFI